MDPPYAKSHLWLLFTTQQRNAQNFFPTICIYLGKPQHFMPAKNIFHSSQSLRDQPLKWNLIDLTGDLTINQISEITSYWTSISHVYYTLTACKSSVLLYKETQLSQCIIIDSIKHAIASEWFPFEKTWQKIEAHAIEVVETTLM